jgi:hypothetical protein
VDERRSSKLCSPFFAFFFVCLLIFAYFGDGECVRRRREQHVGVEYVIKGRGDEGKKKRRVPSFFFFAGEESEIVCEENRKLL